MLHDEVIALPTRRIKPLLHQTQHQRSDRSFRLIIHSKYSNGSNICFIKRNIGGAIAGFIEAIASLDGLFALGEGGAIAPNQLHPKTNLL